jgi:hypothetical protein
MLCDVREIADCCWQTTAYVAAICNRLLESVAVTTTMEKN